MKNVFNHRLAGLLVTALAAGSACHAADRPDGDSAGVATARTPTLVYHEIGADGTVIETHRAGHVFNPASVMKIATTLWVLETLGPEHRFTTRFGYRGTFEPDKGRVTGDLIVAGGGDPDFHVENAYLVARELNRLGIREVTGGLRVDHRFWIGWEGGSEKRQHDLRLRATGMAERLRDALDPSRWSGATRRGMDEFRARRSLDPGQLPAIVVRGAPGREPPAAPGELEPTTWVTEHRSNPVVLTLKRFNAFSNNDIERFEISVGPPAELNVLLAERLELDDATLRVATLSGLGSNRLNARAVVELLEALRTTCAGLGLTPGDVLPVLGCDPGTLTNFPHLDDERYRGALVAKTGSLNETDGGVAVLAGILATRTGHHVFCVASPQAGGRLPAARAEQERWLLDRIVAGGGPRPGRCPAPLPFSDTDAHVGPAGTVRATGTP